MDQIVSLVRDYMHAEADAGYRPTLTPTLTHCRLPAGVTRTHEFIAPHPWFAGYSPK